MKKIDKVNSFFESVAGAKIKKSLVQSSKGLTGKEKELKELGLDIPEDKTVLDMPLTHWKTLIDKKGYKPVIQGLTLHATSFKKRDKAMRSKIMKLVNTVRKAYNKDDNDPKNDKVGKFDKMNKKESWYMPFGDMFDTVDPITDIGSDDCCDDMDYSDDTDYSDDMEYDSYNTDNMEYSDDESDENEMYYVLPEQIDDFKSVLDSLKDLEVTSFELESVSGENPEIEVCFDNGGEEVCVTCSVDKNSMSLQDVLDILKSYGVEA